MTTTALLTTLVIHPIIAALPPISEHTTEVRVMVASIHALGRIIEPLKVNAGRVVDGRVRLVAASIAGLQSVPIEEVDGSAVASIALHSLLARKHYTKSARAYLAVPMIEEALVESRRRALEAARIGVSASKTGPLKGLATHSVDDIADQMGVGRNLLFTAKAIHKKFANGPRILREEWEPKILNGDMGLGEVQQAIAGKMAALEGRTTPKGDAQQLLFDLFASAKVRFARWESLDAQARKAAVTQFRTDFLPSLPPELIEEAERFLSTRLTHA